MVEALVKQQDENMFDGSVNLMIAFNRLNVFIIQWLFVSV